MSSTADSQSDLEPDVLEDVKPWTTRNGLPHFEPSSGMAYALAFAMINDRIEPTDWNRPTGFNSSFTDEYLKAYDNVMKNDFRYRQWFIMLIACHKVKALEENVLKDFFKLNDVFNQDNNQLLDIIQYCSVGQPDSVRHAASRSSFEDCEFFVGHMAKGTTLSIVRCAINSSPIPGVFKTHDIGAVLNASGPICSMEFSRVVPESTLFKAHAVLEALGIAPSTWYAGRMARDRGDEVVYRSLVQILKEACSVCSGGLIPDAATRDACIEKLASLDLEGNWTDHA